MTKTKSLSIVKWLIIVFLAMFLFIQLYHSLYTSFSTESAIYYETYDGIDITGFIIRDESVIESDISGIKRYTMPEGGRVSKNGVIAEVYNSESAMTMKTRTEEIDKEIAALTELQSYNDLTAADVNLLDAQINTAYIHMMESSDNGSYKNIEVDSAEMLRLMNRKQIVTGKTDNFTGLLDRLKTEKNSLASSGMSVAAATITSAYSGYFVSAVDGYEGKLSTDKLDEITPDMINDLKPSDSSVSSKVVGKVVADYEWYIAANVSFEESLKLKENEIYTMKTPLDTMPELPVTIKYINKGTTGDDVTIIFSCKYMNGELASIRTQPMTIVLESYKGLKINRKAIRIVKGEKGVYVVTGSGIKFVPVEITYSDESFSVCKMADNNDSGLRLYDEVVVKGKDLYDGKIVR